MKTSTTAALVGVLALAALGGGTAYALTTNQESTVTEQPAPPAQQGTENVEPEDQAPAATTPPEQQGRENVDPTEQPAPLTTPPEQQHP